MNGELDKLINVVNVDWNGKPINNGDKFDEDYFLRGKQTGKSLYENYHWMPEVTLPMVQAICDNLGISKDQDILDFGCARGYVVRALRELGYNGWGYDISEWALSNADEKAKDYLIVNDSVLIENTFDWVLAKDVLEHIPQVADKISDFLTIAREGVFAVVPLSDVDGEKYAIRDNEKDITHIHRLTLATWARLFIRPGWSVEARYRFPGVKDAQVKYKTSNGFIVARRIGE